MITYTNGSKQLVIYNNSPVSNMYKTSGELNKFMSSIDIINYINENNMRGPELSFCESDNNIFVWNVVRNTRSTDIHAYVGVDKNVVECKISLDRNGCSTELIDAPDNITSRKLAYDANLAFENSQLYFEEKEKLSLMPDYSNDIKSIIKEECGNVLLFDEIDLVGDNVKLAYIPIRIFENGEVSPMVAAKVIISNGEIDIGDVKNKVKHLKEMHFGRIGNKSEKVAKKSRLSYRKTKNNKKTSKKPKNFKNTLNVSRSQSNQKESNE